MLLATENEGPLPSMAAGCHEKERGDVKQEKGIRSISPDSVDCESSVSGVNKRKLEGFDKIAGNSKRYCEVMH